MRLILTTLATLLIFSMCLLTTKFWGKSQVFTEYKHPMLQQGAEPILFIKPGPDHLTEMLSGEQNLYLNVAVTADQQLVVPKNPSQKLRFLPFDEVKNDVIRLRDYEKQIAQKKLILNISENAQAVHEIFLHEMKEMNLDKGDNFIVVSEYEAPIKAMKELAPALVYGTTKPEILKIVAMQSMFVLEAATIRADVIMHPLKIRGQEFFNAELMEEMKRRFKKIVVGPVAKEELDQARSLHPMGIILSE